MIDHLCRRDSGFFNFVGTRIEKSCTNSSDAVEGLQIGEWEPSQHKEIGQLTGEKTHRTESLAVCRVGGEGFLEGDCLLNLLQLQVDIGDIVPKMHKDLARVILATLADEPPGRFRREGQAGEQDQGEDPVEGARKRSDVSMSKNYNSGTVRTES